MAVEKLQKHELFGLLSSKDIGRLSSASGVAQLKEGDKVYSEGIPASHLFVLLKGRVELRKPTREGPSLVVDDLIEGSIFGVSALMGTGRCLLNAECVEDSEVLKIECKVLRQPLGARVAARSSDAVLSVSGAAFGELGRNSCGNRPRSSSWWHRCLGWSRVAATARWRRFEREPPVL